MSFAFYHGRRLACMRSVSYTHLDVYKRQEHLLTVYFLVDESELEDCYMQVSPSSSMAGYYEYMTIYLGEGE